MSKITNKMFRDNNKVFQTCCERMEVEPTTRQASKFRRGLGTAYKAAAEVRKEMNIKKIENSEED